VLTTTKATKLRPGDKPLLVGGATGLYLHAGSSFGSGKFVLRFTAPKTGKRRDMGLGTFPETGLAEARCKAIDARNLIAQGIDPIEDRRHSQDAERQLCPTFADAVHRVFETLAPSFRNRKHRQQWINTMETYVLPVIGTRGVDSLTVADFANVLEPIWLTKEETASRVKQRCGRVMIWCVANGYCTTNPISAVDALLPKQRVVRDRVTHHPATPWRALPTLVASLSEPQPMSISRKALLFLILTASRSGETRGAVWDEIDWDRAIWTIPGDRMKARRPHRAPLSRQALGILDAQRQVRLDGDWIFSPRGTKAMSDMTLTKVLRLKQFPSDIPGRPATAHGFRSSFRDWASEQGYARDIAERALAHTIANSTEAAYHRTDQLDRRRDMMQAWGNFVYGRQIEF